MRKILNNLDNSSKKESSVQRFGGFLSQPFPKRFYKEVSFTRKEKGFSILLDGKPVKTPERRCLFVPTKALAVLVAQEFGKQEEHIDPEKMPITRLVNTVVDRISDDAHVIFSDLLHFVDCDMILYRAQTPKELVEKQRKQWDFLLNWAEEKFGACFNLIEGLTYVKQPCESLQKVSDYLHKIESPYILAALHAMTTLTGSALIALAVVEKKVDAHHAWSIAHLDEDWMMEQWGVDKEVMTRRSYREVEFTAASAVIAACL